MSNIRKSARGESCALRLPGVCNFNNETTILAHMKTYGMGTKCRDIHAVYACSDCHDVIDKRNTSHSIEALDLARYVLDAIIETQEKLIVKKLLEIK